MRAIGLLFFGFLKVFVHLLTAERETNRVKVEDTREQSGTLDEPKNLAGEGE